MQAYGVLQRQQKAKDEERIQLAEYKCMLLEYAEYPLNIKESATTVPGTLHPKKPERVLDQLKQRRLLWKGSLSLCPIRCWGGAPPWVIFGLPTAPRQWDNISPYVLGDPPSEWK